MSTDGLLGGAARFIDQIMTPLRILRAPVIAAIVAFIGLSAPDQTLEIYRALALDRFEMPVQIGLALITLLAACVVIWYIARNFTLRFQASATPTKTLGGSLLRWLPRLIGALPVIGAGIGLLRAAKRITPVQIEPWFKAQMGDVYPYLEQAAQDYAAAGSFLTYTGIGLLVIAVFFMIFTFIRSHGRIQKFENPNRFLFGRALPLLGFLVMALIVAAYCIFYYISIDGATVLAIEIGSIAIFNIFIIFLTLVLGFLSFLHYQTKFPAITVLILIAILSTAFDLNDNHEVRKLNPNVEQQDNVSFELTRWMKARPDREYYQTRSFPYLDKLGLSPKRLARETEKRRQYPIYVVAAQGGGLYAAHQTALALARAQDRCPAFAQHIFAISGVSGGSLGAALFAALVNFRTRDKPPVKDPTCIDKPVQLSKPGWYEEKVNEFMSNDFLSPVAAAGLFPDFLQRFIPYPINGFDRARAFEASMERAWRKAVPEDRENSFAKSFYKMWDSSREAPALVLNTVEVQSGSRRLIAPFVFKGKTLNSLKTVRPIIKHEIALSTAVGLSSRFPWILPAATVNDVERRQFRFVDGGIYEYSGAATALEIAEYMKGHLKYVYAQFKKKRPGYWDANARVQILAISDDEILEDASEPRPVTERSAAMIAGKSQRRISQKRGLRVSDGSVKYGRQGFGELLSPVRSLLNSRIERAVVWVTRTFHVFCMRCYKDREFRRPFPGFFGAVGLYRLNHTDYRLTLGWQLSQATRQIISAHSGFAHNCRVAIPEIYGGWPWAGLVFNQNNCAACRIEHDLETSWLTLVSRMKRNIKIGPKNKSFVKLCNGDDLENPDLAPPPPVQPVSEPPVMVPAP